MTGETRGEPGGPAVAQLDTGDLEIVCSARDSLRSVVAYDRSLNELWAYTLDDKPCSIPVAVDLDGDTRDEIVVGLRPDTLVVIDENGQALPGWPVSTGVPIGNGDRLPSPGVADILPAPDFPGLEIVLGVGNGAETIDVKIFALDGTELVTWQYPYVRSYVGENGVRSPLTIKNVVGNALPELLHGTDLHHVMAWNPATGTVAEGWPIVLRESVRGKVVVADLSGAGENQIVASDLAGLVHVWGFTTTVTVAAEVAPARNWLGANRPNPFNPWTVIPFEVSTEGSVTLQVYETSGRLVRQLVHERLVPGRYDVNWDGRNDAGLRLPSGVYFYQLGIDGRTVGNNKLVLLK